MKKQNSRVQIFLLYLFIFLCGKQIYGQTAYEQITLAKRNNFSNDRTIKPENMGQIKSWTKIYFKIAGSDDAFKPVGIFGKNVKKYLITNPLVNKKYSSYRNKKITSFALVGTYLASFALWYNSGISYIQTHKSSNPKDILTPFFGNAPSLIFLGTTFLSGVGSDYLHFSSEKDLIACIEMNNRTIGLIEDIRLPENKIGLNLNFDSILNREQVCLSLCFHF